MATLTVGPSSQYASIAAALAAANPGDTISLEASYTEAGTVSVTKDNLSFNGDTTNTGIHLALANGISTVSLLGTAPFRVDDNAGSSTFNGNNGNEIFQVTSGSDTDHGGTGNDTLIVDYHTATTAVTGGATGNSSPTGYSGSIADGAGNSVSFSSIENLTITTGSGNDDLHLGDATGGNDVVSLGTGNDFVYSGTGIDQIDGGGGDDGWGADMSSQTGGITIDLTAASSTFLTTGSVTGIEYLGGDGSFLHTFATGSGGDTIVTTSGNFQDSISTNDGNDTITVAGGVDNVNGGAGNDRLIVDYHTSTTAVTGGAQFNSGPTGYGGSISDGAGNSVSFGGIENFTTTTGSGNDSLHLGDDSGGNDVVSLGSGDDFIYSGTGVDQIDGGIGTDRWNANMSAAVAGDNVSINLNNASSTFTIGGVTGSVAGIEALGAPGSGYFTTGAGDDTIVTRTDLNLEDDISTNGGNDTVTIGATTGASVSDHVDGGAGRDRLIVDYSTMTVDLDGNFGRAGDVSGGYAGEFGIHGGQQLVSQVVFEDFTVRTGSGNDTILTGDGNDVVSSGGGNDLIRTFAGVDQVDGGTGTDRWAADMSAAVAGDNVSINLNNASSTFIVGGLTGSEAGIEALGSPGNAFFLTGGGDDTIVTRTDLNLEDDIDTGAGNDTVTIGGTAGTAAGDTVHGGLGHDRLIVDYSTATAAMDGNFARAGDAINGYAGEFNITAGARLVTEDGFEDFTISTGSGSDNIRTGDGDDIINPGTGNDVVFGAGGTDRLIVDYHTATNAVTMAAPTGTMGAEYSGSVTDGSPAFTITFDGIDNFTITGGSGDDAITTGDGDDVIRGGVGQDTVHAAGGSDTLLVGTGDVAAGDVFDGGLGSDTLQVISTADLTGTTLTSIENLAFATSATATVTFTADQLGGANLAAALAVTGDANTNQIVVNLPSSGTVDLSHWTFTSWTTGTDTITVNGSADADTITGSIRNDTLNGGAQNDQITGGAGNDVIDGGDGIDTIYYSGDKAEYTASASGADVIVTDTHSGRDGVDTFRHVEFVQFADQLVAVNTAPAFASLSTAASTERAFDVLDSNVTVADTELDALNSTNGDYSGATLTISRHLGPSADDAFDFAANGDFNVVGGNTLQVSGSTFATFTSTGGTLTISFANSGAVPTTALVNSVLQHITYANQNHNPPASVTLDWTIDDGQTNAFGGAFSATSAQTVNIAAVDDAPINTVPGAQTATEDTTLTISGLSVSDADSGAATITTTLSVAHGTLNVLAGVSGGLTLGQIAGQNTATISLTGTEAQIRATLTAASSVHYTSATDYNGADLLTVTTDDQNHTGSGGPLTDTDTVAITIDEVNDSPIANNDPLSTIGEDAGTQSIAFTALTTNDLKGPLTATDETGQILTVTIVNNPVGGTVEITGGHVAFTPTANFNGTASFDYTITDNGTTAGSPAPKTATATASFTVTAANDAPVVTNGTTATLAAIDEDATNPSGATVTSLFGGHFSDATDQVTGGSSANTFAGVAVTANAATASQGEWQYFASSAWHAIGSVSDSSALLLAASTQVRFLPTAQWNGTTPALTVHLVDNSGGAITTGGTADISTAGGTTPYSSGTVALSETVNAVNDVVTASAPTTASLAEDAFVAISGLSIADVDATLAPNGVYQVTLTASHGALTLTTMTGLTFTAGDGTSDAMMTFHGTLADINTALATASYAGAANHNGSDTIAFTATDSFNSVVATGSGSASSDTKTIAVTVTAVNDAVSASAPASASLTEDASVAISGLSIADADATLAPNGVYEVSLSASHGALTLSTLTGLTFTAGDGTSDAAMTFHGTLAAINTALATASYAGASNYNGSDSISFTVTDSFNSVVAAGTGAATNDSKSIAVTISAVSDAVTAGAPTTATVAEDASVAISGLSIADVDAVLAPNGVYQVTLSASHGALTLSTLTGLTFTAGDGTSDATMTFHGTLAAINTALATASYAGAANYNGADTIAFMATDSFNSVVATGSGSASSDTKNIAVTVTAANDPVTASAPATASLAEDASVAIGGLSIADVDATLAPNGVYQVTLSASHGALTMSTLTGLTFTAGDGTSDATMTLHGTLAAINTALTTASYAGAANYNGSDSIAFTVTDSFNSVVATGTGSATSDSKSIAVTITEVNDAPTATADTLTSVAEDSSQRTILGTTLTGNDSTGPSNESGQSLTVTAVSSVVGGSAIVSGGNVLFTPTANFNGTASFSYTVTDNGTTNGSADAKTALGSASFTVTAVNDPVTASAPSTLSLSEDVAGAIGALSIADIDATLAPNGVYEASLSAGHGAITLGTVSGLAFTAGDGTADGAMTFHGTLAAINAALAGASYVGSSNYNGSDAISFTVTDSFNSIVATGTGAATNDSKSIVVTIVAVDDAPVDTVPGALSAKVDTDLAIAGLSVSDVDAGSAPLTTTLSAGHGTLAAGSAGGATVSGSGTGTVTLNGTLAQINTTLASGGVTYHSASGFSGNDTLTLATDDHGNTGSGSAHTDAHSFTVAVTGSAGPYNWHGSPDLGVRSAPYQVAGVGDFNNDGTSDILWRDPTTGQLDEWHILNGQWAGSTDLGSHGLDWQVVGTGDFDHDGTSNILWRDPTTGHIDEWKMAGGNWAGSVDLGSHGLDWQVAATGDFNGDGTTDILWQNTTTGQLDQWKMAGGNWAGSVELGSHGTDWQVAGTGDFNHDGTSDILWRNPTTGHMDLWLMHNGNWSSSVDLGSFNTAWQLAAVNDFNGDGTTDIIWRNPSTGQVEGWVMENGNWKSSVSLGSFDPGYVLAGSGDFNHDHSADILWRNPTDGHVNEWLLGAS